MAVHRHWRLLFTDGYQDEFGAYVELAELELRASAGGPDQTGAGTASASSTYPDPAFSPENAFDDDPDALWAVDEMLAWPQWLAYDFGAGNEVDIVEYALTSLADPGGNVGQYQAQVFQLQWSDDGAAWTNAEDSRDLTGTWAPDGGETRVFTVGGAEVGGGEPPPEVPGDTIILPLRQRVGQLGTVTLPLRQRVARESGVITLPLRQRVGQLGTVTLPLRQRVGLAGGVLAGANTQRIEPVVLLGGVDVSARLTGPCDVDREESAAAVAEFTLQPFAGPVDLVTWLGAPVQISVRIDGAPPQVLFTGAVSDPSYDPRTRLTTFRCTDRLQEILDSLPLPTVDTLAGGHWSDAVFRSDVTGWQRAQDRMSTQPAALDIAPAGGLRRTAWLAKATADFAFHAGNILDDTLRVEPAPWREHYNRIDLTVELRYQRRLHRERSYRWVYPGGFHTYIQDATSMPTEDDIRRAATGAGWQVVAERFTRFPPSGIYNGFPWVHNPDKPPYFVTEADITAARRWTETVTETYQYTITAPASIARFGEQARTDYLSIAPDAPDIAWEDVTLPLRTGGLGGLTDMIGASTAPNGDRYFDDLPPAEVDNAFVTALAQVETIILAAHRGNSIEFSTPLLPDVDLIHTVSVTAGASTARGKVRQVVHRLATSGQGESTTTVRVAVSQAADVAVAASPLAAPPRIATAPTVAPPPLGVDNQTHLGGNGSGSGPSPPITPLFERQVSQWPQDPAWTGWVGNYNLPIPWNAPLYDESFTIDWGDIPREPTVATRALPHTVAIPHETLEVAA